MEIFDLLILAIGLSMDAFAVSICKGLALGRASWKQSAWVGLWFGGFQAIMPFLGFLLANSFQAVISAFDHWIAFVLLVIIGGGMLREALSGDEEETSGDLGIRAMLLLAIATSIDALAAGISLVAVVELPLFAGGVFQWNSIGVAVSCIGLVTFLLSTIGVKMGARIGGQYGKKAELLGGGILILLGLKILLEHTGIIG